MDDTGKPTDEDFFMHKADAEDSDFDDLAIAGGEEPDQPQDEPVEDEPKKPDKPSLVDQFKQLPRAAQIGAAGAAVILVLGLVWFLFLRGEEKKPGRRSPPATARQQTPQQPSQPAQQSEDTAPEDGEETAQQPGEETGQPAEETPGEEAPEEPPKRPDDFAEWVRPDDFLAARAEEDGRLVEAIAHLGQTHRGAPNAGEIVALLVQLLAPPEPPESAGEPAPGTGQPGPRAPIRPAARPSARQAGDVTEAVVAALIALDAEPARQALLKLLAGELPCENDAAAVDAVFEQLAANPSRENQELLFRALRDADALRPSGRGDVTAAELRDQAYESAQPIASQEYRIALARYLLQPTTPREWRERFGETLLSNETQNVPAQMLYCQDPQTAEAVLGAIRGHFLDRSSAAMAHVLGLPAEALQSGSRRGVRPGTRPGLRPGTRPGVRPGAAAASDAGDAAVHRRMAELLWGQWFVGQLQARLDKVNSLDGYAELVMLGATVPADSMRATVFQALEDNWEDGPAPLEKAGLDGKLVTDPGLLLSLKALPRSEARDTTKTTTRPGTRPRPAPGRRTRRPQRTVSKTVEEQEKAKQEWMEASKALLLTWCGRFHATALAKAEAARLSGGYPPQGEAVSSLAQRAGLKLHDGAKVVAEYHRVWPGEFAAQLSGLSPGPMLIDYVCIEEQNKPVAMTGYYRRQVGVRDLYRVENGAWLDSVKPVPPSDRKRSLDVVITRLSPDSEADRDEPEDLRIEILGLELKDPAAVPE